MKDTIDRWGHEDGIDTSHVTVQYEDLGNKTLGQCRYKWVENNKGAEIGISYRLQTHYTKLGVLWHEYSHYYEWVTYGTTGHAGNWLKS